MSNSRLNYCRPDSSTGHRKMIGTIWHAVPFTEILYLVFVSQCLTAINCCFIVLAMDALPVPWCGISVVVLTLKVALLNALMFQSYLRKTVNQPLLKTMTFSHGQLVLPISTLTNREMNSFESNEEIPLTESVKDSSNQQRMTQVDG